MGPYKFHAVVVHGIDFKELSKKKRDVPVVFLNKPITFERSRRRSFVTSLFYWLASMERFFYFKFRPIHVQYA